MNRNILHFHPKGGVANVFGRRPGSEEVIRKGDFCPTVTIWEPVPKRLIGSTVGEHPETLIIRPAKEWKRPKLPPEKSRDESHLFL